MAQWNQIDKTLHTKIVYWGPALGGKTTNLQQIHAITDPGDENRLISINTASDRTLFFDLLPLEMGRVLGHTLKVQLYTVPGQVRYDATRRVVLSGADAVVFVADSQRGKGAENRGAWDNLRANLKVNGLDSASMPVVVQFNKQDVADCLRPEQIEATLQSGMVGIPASALRGRGVLETFQTAVLAMIKRLTILTGRRRAEDMRAVEEQVARAFERFQPTGSPGARSGLHLDSSVVVGTGQTAEAAPAPSLNAMHPPEPSGSEPVATAADSGTGSERASGVPAPEPRLSSFPTVRLPESGVDDDLLLRSLKATLGIAEQFGEMRDIKNKLTRRVSELESLQTLAHELASRTSREEILIGLADAALTIPGARASSILMRQEGGTGMVDVVVRGALRDPLLEGGGTSTVETMFHDGEPLILDALPIPGASARAEAALVRCVIAAPLAGSDAAPLCWVLGYAENPFNPEDLRFLGLMASHAGVCLANAEMLARLSGQNEVLERKVQARTRELNESNKALKELDAMKDRFMAAVSHEMRTPLTGILSGIDLIRGIAGELDGSREFLGMIEHEAQRLASLVDRIIRFQILGRSPADEGADTLDVQELVRCVASDLADKANERGIEIALDLDERLPFPLGDRESLRLAVREIIENAVKFSPRDERVLVTTRELMIRAAGSSGESQRFIVVSVTDRGPGVRPEDRARIFERFEQVGELLTSKPDGLGLGLSIAREIARRHGGDLRIKSDGERGSEFRLYVPLQRQHAEHEELASALEKTR